MASHEARPAFEAAGAARRTTLAGWRSLPHSPLVAALALFLISLAAALSSALSWTDGRLIYALDDSYIHMAVARTLATHGVWGCTPFHFSSSSSSPLWTLGLAAAFRALGVRDWIPLAMNVVLGVATLVVAERALARLGAPPLVRAATLLGIVVALPLTGMTLIGMEHVLHLLLTIGFAALAVETLTDATDSPRLSRRRTVALCAGAALLGASRYEGLFLVGLVCLALLARRQPRRAVSIGLASILPVAAFGVISVANGSYFLPNPLMVKAVGGSASTLQALIKPFGSEDLEFLRNNRAMPILLVLALLGAIAGWRARRELFRPAVLYPLLLAGMIALHGHFVFSPLYWAYRYDAYLVGFGLFVAAVVTAELSPPRALARGALPALLVAALVPIVADVRQGLTPEAEIEGMRNTYLEEYETAQYVRLYHPEAAVIVNDLGAVSYYTDARILDLVGLGDIEPVRIMRSTGYTSRDVTAWTAPYRPKLAILQLGWSVVAPLIPPDWVRVAVVEVPPHRHRVGFFAVDRAEAWSLRASVAQHFGPLVRARGYRLRLAPAGELDAARPASP